MFNTKCSKAQPFSDTICVSRHIGLTKFRVDCTELLYGPILLSRKRGYAYHKPQNSPTILVQYLSVTVHGVHQIQFGLHRAVVRSNATAKHPEVVTMQVKGVLLCAVASC